MRSRIQNRVIELDNRSGSPGAAHRGVHRFPATSRVDAKKRPSNRSPRSFSSRFCQLWASKIQPLEDPGQLRRDRSLSLAEEPAGVERASPPRREEREERRRTQSAPINNLIRCEPSLTRGTFALLTAFSLLPLRVFAVNKEIPADDRRYIAVIIRHVRLERRHAPDKPPRLTLFSA